MGFAKPADFETARRRHTGKVRQIYDRLLQTGPIEAEGEFPPRFQGREAEWKKILAAHSFRDVEKSLRLLNEFAHGPGYVHVSPRTTELALRAI